MAATRLVAGGTNVPCRAVEIARRTGQICKGTRGSSASSHLPRRRNSWCRPAARLLTWNVDNTATIEQRQFARHQRRPVEVHNKDSRAIRCPPSGCEHRGSEGLLGRGNQQLVCQSDLLPRETDHSASLPKRPAPSWSHPKPLAQIHDRSPQADRTVVGSRPWLVRALELGEQQSSALMSVRTSESSAVRPTPASGARGGDTTCTSDLNGPGYSGGATLLAIMGLLIRVGTMDLTA
jgi:hypothetical protein